MSQETEHVKVHIERSIERARHGVGEGIDELDRRIRGTMDIRSKAEAYAETHAPQLIVAGAALGFVVGFGMPNLIKRTLQFGIPILIALKVAQAQSDAELASTAPVDSLYPGNYS